MSTRSIPTPRPIDALLPWQVSLQEVLEESHIAAWSTQAKDQSRFASELGTALSGLDGSLVCVVDGSRVHSLQDFSREFSRAMIHSDAQTRVTNKHGVCGVVEALRTHPGSSPRGEIKRRYIVWTHAENLLVEEPATFSRLADAMMGVAAESEYVSEDRLLIQRVVFVGGKPLANYACEPKGQFQRWLSESAEPPLWKVITGRDSPVVTTFKIPELWGDL